MLFSTNKNQLRRFEERGAFGWGTRPLSWGMSVEGRRVTRDEGGEADLVEISGAIKWFDVAKGYGFILPDGGDDWATSSSM